MKVSFPHTDLLIEHLAQGTKVSSILFDQAVKKVRIPTYHDMKALVMLVLAMLKASAYMRRSRHKATCGVLAPLRSGATVSSSGKSSKGKAASAKALLFMQGTVFMPAAT